MTSDQDLYQRVPAGGAVSYGVSNAGAPDHAVAELRFPGMPGLGPTDRVGPGFASELGTEQLLHYGLYRARLQLARCTGSEEVVNGIFTYFNDGTDHDADGLVDNAEIDIEILCATPTVVFLTAWTDYDESGFRRWTRAIDLSTGDYYEPPNDHEFGLDYKGNDPSLIVPGFPTQSFYELGFDWQPTSIRFFLDDLTLWSGPPATYVPSLPSAWLFNVWHPGEHWFGGGAPPDYPSNDAVMLIDWARYWAH